jgi:cystathionine gamma-synthase
MAPKILTEHFGSIPPHPHHAITVHLPKWEYTLKFMNKDMEFLKKLKNMYPRMMIHEDLKEVRGHPHYWSLSTHNRNLAHL